MSDENNRGVCPHCGQEGGQVGMRCEEAVCRRQGYNFIPITYARVVDQRARAGEYIDPEIGRIVDRYLVVGKIGQGGMGAVFLALQMPLEREVALKMIPGVTLDETSRGRFEREAKAISILYHPNIVQLYEYGFNPVSGAPFMAMEYVKGGRELMDEIVALRDASLPWAASRVERIFGQVLSALQTAHDQGLVHRDIKPQNIMLVDVEGTSDFVKILDFGLARTLQRMPGMDRLTGTGTVVGTPQYIAPEQLVAGRDIDHRSDLYSVGAALFEVVTGLTAYPGVDPRAVLSLKLDPDYDPVARIARSGLHPPLRELLARAMARNPAMRFEKASQMRAALAESLKGAPPLGRGAVATGEMPLVSGPVDAEASTVASDRIEQPGTMEISSYERPSTDRMEMPDEEFDIPQRAPVKLIVAGALTGLVLLAAVLTVVFVVLPTMKDRGGDDPGSMGTPSGLEDAASAADAPVVDAGGVGAVLVKEPEGIREIGEPEPPTVVEQEQGPEGKKKVKRAVDAETTPAADPGAVASDPGVDPGHVATDPGPATSDPGPPDQGAQPDPVEPPPFQDPVLAVKKALAKLGPAVAKCLPTPQGKVTIAVVVNPATGRPDSVKVSGFYPGGSKTTQCISSVIDGLDVGPFEGDEVVVPHVYEFEDEVGPTALPETLNPDVASSTLKKARGWIVACSAGMTGDVKLQITVEGKSGDAIEAVVTNPPFAATPEGDCMEKALEKMLKFPPFAKEKITITHTFSL